MIKLLILFQAQQYFIKVYTGHKQAICGTDMNASVRLFGDFEVSKVFKLFKTKTHEKKFERDQVKTTNF